MLETHSEGKTHLDFKESDIDQSVTIIRILLVEDEQQLRTMIRAVLTADGYEVVCAENADEALVHLIHEKFHLILSDIMMPGKSGIDLLEMVKKDKPNQEIILMTGYPKVEAAVHAVKVGAFDYLTKPFDLEYLKERIKAALVHRKKKIKALILNETADGNDAYSTLAGYTIIRTIGEGTMGMVLLVEKDEKQFAMKIIKTTPLSDEDEKLSRFFMEAESAGTIKHPNIVEVFEHGYTHDEIPYMVMEYIEGFSLSKHIDKKDLTTRQKIKILMQISSAIAATHKQGIIHRDIKPDNIIIDQNLNAKLTDFGIAQLPNSELTNMMKLVGTPYYMAPEGFDCPKVDGRADIFSLGIVAYELLFGQRPFNGDSISGLGFRIQTANPISPFEFDKEVSKDLIAILSKMLKKDPNKRYQNAELLSIELEHIYRSGIIKTKRLLRPRWNTL